MEQYLNLDNFQIHTETKLNFEFEENARIYEKHTFHMWSNWHERFISRKLVNILKLTEL